MKLEMLVSEKLGKAISESSNQEIYQALMAVVQDMAEQKESNAGKKKVYYVSAEFLIGKLLSNNMINLGIYEDVCKMLAANGKDICEIEEVEAEPSLGNGGLGRLAACFLDSIATLGYWTELSSWIISAEICRSHAERNKKSVDGPEWLVKTYGCRFSGVFWKYDIAVCHVRNSGNRIW